LAAALKSKSGVNILDNEVTPQQKSSYVQNMFDNIAGRYDLLNTILSLGIDVGWRNYAVRCAALTKGDRVLDGCAGTGELGAAASYKVGRMGQVVSVDFSLPMLRAGAGRYASTGGIPAQSDVLHLPFADNSFDAALVGFGLRNVADPAAGVKELARVVKPGGRVVILEFSSPRVAWFAKIFEIYSRTVMPILGGLISGKREAYTYLPESVRRWLTREELRQIMHDAGLIETRYSDLTFGVACVHVGNKG
jgi:demethylmenaquinone methyltransferase/2-methoxy-6-polyprenyl-1,4-benzoquinol methylase